MPSKFAKSPLQVDHTLLNQHKEERHNFAALVRQQDGEGFLHNVWFSEETYLHLIGMVNKQNVRFWATEHPKNIHESDNYGKKVSVWAAISSHGIIGLFFFNEMVHSKW